MMDIFISYRDSATDAELEFRRLFRKAGLGESFRLPSIGASADGWSRMLPGLVCDLRPDDARHKAPAIFMGMLGEQSMLSCALQPSNSLTRKPSLGRLLRRGDYKFSAAEASSHWPDRLDFVSKIVDGTVSIQEIEPPRPFPHAFNWGPAGAPSFTDSGGRHLRFPNLEQLEQIEYGHHEGPGPLNDRLNDRLADFLELLAHAPTEVADDPIFRRLAHEYHCRVAWASVQLDETPGDAPFPMTSAPFPFEAHTFALYDADKNKFGQLKTFWEKRGLLSRPFGISAYSSLVERRGPVSWPYWLQFLVLISNAGRRANATFRKYSFSNMLRSRHKDDPKGVRKRLASHAVPPKTMAELFRGSTRPRPVMPAPGRRAAILRGYQTELLLEIRRRLIVPGADTILSLYRGGPAPPAILKAGDED